MSAVDDSPPPRRGLRRHMSLLLGLCLALAGGGGAYIYMSGDLSVSSYSSDRTDSAVSTAFVSLDPLVVTLPRASGRQFLRFTAALEVSSSHRAEVEALKPRLVDVMNEYLRAVAPADFETQLILLDIRSQLLRRLQVVTGPDVLKDLLVQEFILN